MSLAAETNEGFARRWVERYTEPRTRGRSVSPSAMAYMPKTREAGRSYGGGVKGT